MRRTASIRGTTLSSRTYLPNTFAKVPDVRGCPRPFSMNPSLAMMASGLTMAARVCSSDRPWMITVPPAARALPNVLRVRRSPVDTSWCSPKRASGQVCQSSNSADLISVMPAP